MSVYARWRVHRVETRNLHRLGRIAVPTRRAAKSSPYAPAGVSRRPALPSRGDRTRSDMIPDHGAGGSWLKEEASHFTPNDIFGRVAQR